MKKHEALFHLISEGSNGMKVLIKNEDTGMFLTDHGQRTPDRDEATDFQTTWGAISFCYRNNLCNSALVIESGGHHYQLPVRCDD